MKQDHHRLQQRPLHQVRPLNCCRKVRKEGRRPAAKKAILDGKRNPPQMIAKRGSRLHLRLYLTAMAVGRKEETMLLGRKAAAKEGSLTILKGKVGSLMAK